jgi:NAD(P)-dependent dehydrogenase (short-subunit alcohol dehydrogenase family)
LISGAGSGIGRAIAIELAAQGDQIFLLGRNEKTLNESRELCEGNEHQIVVADISDKEAVLEAVKNIKKLNGLIANAGVGGENDFESSEDRWNEIINTNLTGSYYLTHALLAALKKGDGHKHIVFISSILARLGVPGYSAYCASKAGLLGLMRSLAAELTADKILVNALCPGWVNTAMAREGIEGFAKATGQGFEEALKEQMSYVPLGKMSEAKEIAEMIAYLTSKNQLSITGQSFDINNGALMPS